MEFVVYNTGVGPLRTQTREGWPRVLPNLRGPAVWSFVVSGSGCRHRLCDVLQPVKTRRGLHLRCCWRSPLCAELGGQFQRGVKAGVAQSQRGDFQTFKIRKQGRRGDPPRAGGPDGPTDLGPQNFISNKTSLLGSLGRFCICSDPTLPYEAFEPRNPRNPLKVLARSAHPGRGSRL